MRLGPPPRMTTLSRVGWARPRDGQPACLSPTGQAALVGGVHVGGGRGELGRAGVDALEHRPHVECDARACAPPPRSSPPAWRAARPKSPSPSACAGCSAAPGRPCALHARLHVDDLLDALRNHGSMLAGGVDLLVIDAQAAWPAPPSGCRSGVGWPSAARIDVLVVALAEAVERRGRRAR